MGLMSIPLHGGDPTKAVVRDPGVDANGNYIPTQPAAGAATAATFKTVAPKDQYEAYWFAQPPEVQALMKLPVGDARTTLAHALADKGFTIDVPIMVWNWDPLATMVVRLNQGFTWVPSGNQDPVRVMPGLTFPGSASYDPKNPPAGSIKVDISWAKGLEKTDPWLYTPDGKLRDPGDAGVLPT